MRPQRMRRSDPIESATRATKLLTGMPETEGVTVFNRSESPLYIDFDDSVTTTDYMVCIPPSGYWESPNRCTDDLFGIWELSNGTALIRSFVGK